MGRIVGVEYLETDLGLEAEIEAGTERERWRGRVHLDFGPIKGSYGWLFPKGEVLTVGVIAGKGNPQETKTYLEDLISMLGLGGHRRIRESGHLTRCRDPRSPVSGPGLLLAGDAGGFLEPWTREGISFALRSGLIAGRQAAAMATAHGFESGDAESAQNAFEAQITGELGPEMAAGFTCRDAFSANPAAFHILLGRTGVGWRYFQRLCSGDTTLASALRHKVARWPLQVLANRAQNAPTNRQATYQINSAR